MIHTEEPIAIEITNPIEVQIVEPLEGRRIPRRVYWRLNDHSREFVLGISVSLVAFVFWMVYLFGTPRD